MFNFAAMKKTIIALMAVFACVQLTAQTTYSYRITKGGKPFTTAQWTETEGVNGAVVDVVTKNVQHTSTTCDKNAKTVRWHISTADGKNDYSVVRNGSTYVVTGKVDGREKVQKELKSAGYPWYQLVNYSAGKIFTPDVHTICYECIRPSNAKITTMSLTITGEENFGGHHCKVVKASTTGAIAGLWSCVYYIDAKTGQYIGYKGVEGFIGTPETQWVLQ